jgi:hypothetical protein
MAHPAGYGTNDVPNPAYIYYETAISTIERGDNDCTFISRASFSLYRGIVGLYLACEKGRS